MKILIATPFFLSAKGGISLHAQALSRHLVRRGHEVVVVTPDFQDVQVTQDGIKVFGVKSFRLPKWPFPWAQSFSVPYRPLSFVSALKRLVRSYEIDLVHAHGQKYITTWVSVDLAYRMKLPGIVRLCGTDALRSYGTFASVMDEIVNQTIFRETARKASAVLYDNELQLQYWSKYCDRSKLVRYTPCIDTSRFTSALKYKERFRKQFEIPPDKKVVLFLGRFDPVKGILELMAAVEDIVMKSDDVIFVIAGGGPLVNEIRSQAKALKDKVKIIDWVPHSQVEKIYALSDIFVLPSKVGGQSRCLLEAMASGLHIVHTAVSGLPETFKEYPYKTYIDRCSPVAISSALVEALNVVSKTTMTETEVSSYVEKFDWSCVISEIEKVYNVILDNSHKT